MKEKICNHVFAHRVVLLKVIHANVLTESDLLLNFKEKMEGYHLKHSFLKISLLVYPPAMAECFAMLDACGATHYTLFGGAVRDADYAARHGRDIHISDYDIRIWLPFGENAAGVNAFIARIDTYCGVKTAYAPGRGSARPRYLLQLEDCLADLSFGDVEGNALQTLPLNAVAIDRIHASNIGLSAVAIDPARQAWARPEYVQDRENLTLTIYPDDNDDRRETYRTKMQEKFPHHALKLASS